MPENSNMILKEANDERKDMEKGEMSPERTLDIRDYENDDTTLHYPDHVGKDNVEGEVVEDYSEKTTLSILAKLKQQSPGK